MEEEPEPEQTDRTGGWVGGMVVGVFGAFSYALIKRSRRRNPWDY